MLTDGSHALLLTFFQMKSKRHYQDCKWNQIHYQIICRMVSLSHSSVEPTIFMSKYLHILYIDCFDECGLYNRGYRTMEYSVYHAVQFAIRLYWSMWWLGKYVSPGLNVSISWLIMSCLIVCTEYCQSHISCQPPQGFAAHHLSFRCRGRWLVKRNLLFSF